jgi:hypothetical protein
MSKDFMDVFEDYSSNGLPLVVPFWNYYLGRPSFSKLGYQPIFYGEVFEVSGIL